jgi:hypothetical protein
MSKLSSIQKFLFLALFIAFFSTCTNSVNKSNGTTSNDELDNSLSKSSENKTYELIYEDIAKSEILADTINDLFLGDCFIIKNSDLEYGFILYEMTDEAYSFAPVRLNLSFNGVEMLKNGYMRMAGVFENKHPECLAMSIQEDINEFKSLFTKIGNLKLINSRPAVTAWSYIPNYSLEEIKTFIKHQDWAYSEDLKIYPKVDLLIQK